jgi:ribosomal protein S18 acetylase RimI-like enzyme
MTPGRPSSELPIAPTVVVREAGMDDLEAVVALRLQLLAEEARSPLFARPRPDIAEQAVLLTQAQLASRTDAIFLATEGDSAIGLLRCSISRGPRLVRPSRYGFITSAYVHPAHRRRGILRAMLTKGEAWCRARGLREVRLHCTVENTEGNASWEALGYRPAEIVRRRSLVGE